MRVLACVSLTLATLLARPTLTRTCSCDVEIHPMPDHGSVDVPTNTKIWLDGGAHCRGSAEPTPRILDPDGVEIAFTSTCLLPDTGFHWVRVLHLNEPLLPNTTYTVIPEADLEYSFPFTTGAGHDHTPPAIPEEVDRTVEHADPGFCDETGTLVASITVAGEAALFVLHAGDSPEFDASTVSGQVAELSQGDSLLLGRSTCHGDNFPGGASRGAETTIRRGALDLAGNFSGWSAPSALSLGDELPSRGCSVLAWSTPAWWLVLAPLFARRRRRARDPRAPDRPGLRDRCKVTIANLPRRRCRRVIDRGASGRRRRWRRGPVLGCRDRWPPIVRPTREPACRRSTCSGRRSGCSTSTARCAGGSTSPGSSCGGRRAASS